MTDLERRKMWFGKDYLIAAILATPAEKIAGFLDEYLVEMRKASHSMRGALAIVIDNVFHSMGRSSPRDESRRKLWMRELENLCLRNGHEMEFFLPRHTDLSKCKAVAVVVNTCKGIDPFFGF